MFRFFFYDRNHLTKKWPAKVWSAESQTSWSPLWRQLANRILGARGKVIAYTASNVAFANSFLRKRIWMHRGEYKRVGPVCWCDMVSNAFLARRDTIARVRWDEAIKTYEHWEFFYRASRIEKLAIAVAVDCSVVHAHVGAKPYGDLRGRPKFRAMGLRKHGFHSMRYPGGGIVNA